MTVIAISLAVIALFCAGIAFVFIVGASSFQHPTFNELLSRREAEDQRLAQILNLIVSAAVEKAVTREYEKRARI